MSSQEFRIISGPELNTDRLTALIGFGQPVIFSLENLGNIPVTLLTAEYAQNKGLVLTGSVKIGDLTEFTAAYDPKEKTGTATLSANTK